MLTAPTIVIIAFLYLCLLFAIAYYGDKRADRGRSIIGNPYIYALSIGVYATSWTFYGSVGRAASSGVGFLPIYIGPTLTFILGWYLIRKIIRISKVNRITSIADFIASRYGKSSNLGGLVTIIAVVGILPYISLQLKAISMSFSVLLGYPEIVMPTQSGSTPVLQDTALYVALLVAAFPIQAGTGYTSWISLSVLAMLAIFVLPRQFQVLVVENVDERHVKKAVWLFPLYLLLINIFVLPIAFGGLLHFSHGSVDADTFVLALPMAERQQTIALLAFIGGLSAATGMMIVETVALSTMVCNDLVMPTLLRVGRLHLSERRDLTGVLLAIRRGAIVVIVLLGYAYVRLIGETYALVTIGLVSFVAAAQFAPAIIGGILWTGATKAGALAGLTGGFLLWIYTLLLPSFARSGWIGESFVNDGPFGFALLRPYELFDLSGLDSIAHALFWTMVVNVGLYVAVSLVTSQTIIERSQANQFVDIFGRAAAGRRIWRGRATIGDLRRLLARFIGEPLAEAAFHRLARERNRRLDDASPADADIVSYVERQLAGAIGASSARIMVASVLREEMHDIDEVMQILDEASELIVYSRRLEEKSQELEAATKELRTANERLKELDKLKDDFVTTVSHELRTPLTSIRSFSEIVHDYPDLPIEERREFLQIIVQESERLTRLLNDILDLAKMEAGKIEWHMADIAPRAVIEQALAATKGLVRNHGKLRLETALEDDLPIVRVDPDRLMQVIVNLISNAVKFSDKETGWVRLEARREDSALRVDVRDNGIGIDKKDHNRIFERFQQAGNTLTEKPAGTGLGLPISREILRHFNGEIWVESEIGKGATFSFRIPAAGTRDAVAAPTSASALEAV